MVSLIEKAKLTFLRYSTPSVKQRIGLEKESEEVDYYGNLVRERLMLGE